MVQCCVARGDAHACHMRASFFSLSTLRCFDSFPSLAVSVPAGVLCCRCSTCQRLGPRVAMAEALALVSVCRSFVRRGLRAEAEIASTRGLARRRLAWRCSHASCLFRGIPECWVPLSSRSLLDLCVSCPYACLLSFVLASDCCSSLLLHCLCCLFPGSSVWVGHL